MKKIFTLIFLITLLMNACLTFAQNTEIEIISINSADPEALVLIARQLLSPEGKVTYEPRTRKLILVDYPENLARIKKVLKEIDVPLKQVQIEVTIAEASNEFLKSGVAGLKLLEKSRDLEIRSKSTITTLSTYPAKIQVADDMVVDRAIYIFSTGTVLVLPIRESIGNVLEVLPRVTDDNTIILNIRPSVSRPTPDTGSIYTESAASTEIAVKDGETIMIGGVESFSETKTESSTIFGLPLSKQETKNPKQIVMFLTAKIIN